MASVKKFRKERSIKTDLFMLLVIIAVAPLLINLSFDIFSLNTRLKESIQENFLEKGENINREIDLLLKSRYTDLLLLSKNPTFTSSESSVEDKIREMTKVQEYYKFFEDITLIDVNGKDVLSTNYLIYIDFIMRTTWFTQAVKGTGVVTSPYLTLKGDRLITNFLVPIYRGDKIVAVILAQMDMAKIWEWTDSVKVGESGHVIIFDELGNVVSHPDKDMIFKKFVAFNSLNLAEDKKENRLITYTDEAGIDYVGSIVEFDNERTYEIDPLYILVVQPKKEAYFFWNSILTRNIMQMILMVSMIVAVSLFFSSKITEPITRIIDGTKEISTDGREGIIVNINSWSEFNKIAQALNVMSVEIKKYTSGLRAYEKELEEKIREKTAELSRSEEKFRGFFETSRDIVFILDTDGLVMDINPAVEEITGIKRRDVIDRNIREFCRDREEWEKIVARVRKKGYVKEYGLEMVGRGGKFRTCLVTMTPRKDEDGEIVGFQGSIRDITERKALEEQLIQSQKMEAVGALAGGIAHNFNNILVGIMGYSEHLLSKKGEDDPDYRALKTIHEGSIRASSLTTQLLNIARGGEQNFIRLNLNELVTKFLPLISGTLDRSISIETRLSRLDLTINGDPGQLEQCLLNLCINARDSMISGGTITIGTFYQRPDEDFMRKHIGAQEGDYVVLSVTDTGVGMSPEIIVRIFEPFFTTKGLKGGTGMGLATVYGIVKNHDGIITVESDVGKGTIFKIFLPAVEGLSG